ncbi:MAG: hypothetical protein M5U16_01275 [Hyphomicrobium sp.]|nr:hypothetical protein [Hyphomicrobium sp.]
MVERHDGAGDGECVGGPGLGCEGQLIHALLDPGEAITIAIVAVDKGVVLFREPVVFGLILIGERHALGMTAEVTPEGVMISIGG